MFLEMSSLTFPSTIISNKKFPIIFQEKNSQFSLYPKKKQLPHDQKYVSSFIHSNQVSSKRNCLLYPLKCNARDNSENNPEEGRFNAGENSENNPEEGQKAMETVQKLYNALKKKDLIELSDIIGEECRCISNFASSLQTFYGKEVC